MNDITEQELVAAILDAIDNNDPRVEPGTIITSELVEHLDCSVGKAKRLIKIAVKQGKLLPERGLVRYNVHGRLQKVDGYRYANGSKP